MYKYKRPIGTDNETYYNWDNQLDESTELLYVSHKQLKKCGIKVREKIKKEDKQEGSSTHIKEWRDRYHEAVKDFSKNVEKVFEIYKHLVKSSGEAEACFSRNDSHTQSLMNYQRTRTKERMQPLQDETAHMHHTKLKQELYEAKQRYEQSQTYIQHLTGELESVRQSEQNMQKQLCDLKDRSRSKITAASSYVEGQTDQLQDEQPPHLLQNLDDKVKTLEQQYKKSQQKIQDLTDEVTAVRQSDERLQKQFRDDQNRLAVVVPNSILDDNNTIPDTTNPDLSVPDRPTIIGDVLSELYDTEWTDCFGELQDNNTKEAEIIHTLLKLLRDIYDTCIRWSTDNFFENVQCAIDRTYVEQDANIVMVELTDDLRQSITVFKKSRGFQVVSSIHKLIRKELPRYFTGQFNSDVFRAYIEKCTEFSWLAAVEDPPLFLNAERVDDFNTSVFREYTRPGPYVEYVVWPALHIKDGGRLLIKGVAQGAKEKPV